MEAELQTLSTLLAEAWTMIRAQAANLLLPSRLTQVAILAGCLALAWGLQRWTSPRMRGWMRTLEGWPKWRLRLLLIVERRLQLIFFVALAWSAVGAMMSVTVFPSRRYILVLIATIATAMLAVALLARLVRNPALRRIVTWSLWAYVILYYLGLTDEAAELLDGLALEFGEFRLTLLAVLKALAVTAVLVALARMIASTSSARIRRNEDISPSMQVLLVKVIQIVLFSAAIFIGLKAVGFDLTGLAVLSGAIGVGLGFGLQKVVSNLVSGVILLLDKSIKPGDVISLGDTFGWINKLGARYVSITTRDGKEYLIPNEDLITGQVVNWSHSNDFVRLDIYFGTAYGADPHLVRRVAIAAASGVSRVLADRPPVCHIVGFGDSSVDYILRFWISDPTGGLTNIRGNVFLALWDAFQENGISIPFPQREVKMLEGSTLTTRAEAAD
ncbi:mechanosensitive ion channel [Psychromarinibacter sp. C21-152]|uniref:Mechanosensitive ion channel n=1 Tax=Psychromarinibacter sediminicola TaxID=3033385 RepID=A0AAE3NSA7_9RHOB|nr:mechanosensitive ion channel domain-containing protein [Psychromarinibacter sediminicola]MDF0601096.1 mechanosensitive ion channel [Psychromarinibacter sediminicola]